MTIQTLRVLSAILSDVDAEWYGLDLCNRAGLTPGTIYPMLDRLLQAGWLERRWEDIDPAVEGRPRRRLYRITALGAPAAQAAINHHWGYMSASEPPGVRRPAPVPRLA